MPRRQPSDRPPTCQQVGRKPLRLPVSLAATGQQGIVIRLFWD
jgi:hypothetical protein